MSLERMITARAGGETVMYVIAAVVWVALQLAGAAARKRKVPSAPPRPARRPAPRPDSSRGPSPSGFPDGADPLQEFLRQLTAQEPVAVESAEEPPRLRPRPPPVVTVNREARPPSGSILISEPPPELSGLSSVKPEEEIRRFKFNPASASGRSSAGRSLNMTTMRFPVMSSFAAPSVGAGRSSRVGRQIHGSFRSVGSRKALRDALIWKTLLDSPRALASYDHGALWISQTE